MLVAARLALGNKVTKVTCKSIMAVLLMNPLGIDNERERGCLVSTHTTDNIHF